MAAHDSIIPGIDEKPRHMRWDDKGGSLSWAGWRRLAIAILMVLGVPTGYAGFQFVTQADLQASEARQNGKVQEVKAEVKKDIAGIHVKIGQLDEKVDGVQDFQVKQDARQEARRITERIQNRTTREREYDRLRELNQKRIKDGKDPCTTLTCSN